MPDRVIVELYMTDLADTIGAVQATVDDIEDKVDTVDTVVDGIASDLETVDGIVDDILEDTGTTLPTTLTTLTNNLATVDTVVDAIKVITDALAVLTETGGTVTATGAETDIYINNAPAGVYKPIGVKIDFTNHTAAETVMITVYYRIKSGGAWLKEDYVVFEGAQDFESIVIDLNPNRYGVRVTIEKGAGTDRNYDWEAVYEV
jgi:hypothetical protein